MNSTFSPTNLQDRLPRDMRTVSTQAQRVLRCATGHAEKIGKAHAQRWLALGQELWDVQRRLAQVAGTGPAAADAAAYGVDAAQRMALTLDVLRERGNNDKHHQDAGLPPVLGYGYETLVDGRDLPRPCNYQLLRILPGPGVEVFDSRRPYMIIDPRAGHGAGIGGFKTDSQVGVALRGGHPVYFVVFRQHPEPGQTLADVMRAEAHFLREIVRRHPDAPKPVIVGNCQGGWATLLLASANPDITGPLVINGAPVATWSGHVGENPMRYNGGLLGGVVPAMLMADLGNGEFDGAHLVSNFEMLNPGRNHFGKYYDLYAMGGADRTAFLDFERWWGGYHYTNESEIRWIIEQLFVGNRLARGEAQLEPAPPRPQVHPLAHHRVRQPRRQHHAAAAGPELDRRHLCRRAGDPHPRPAHRLHGARQGGAPEAVENDRDQEPDFAAVDRLSGLGAELYEMGLRPWVQSLVRPQLADALRDNHPSRLGRRAFSDENPAMPFLAAAADMARASRQPAAPGNPSLGLERVAANGFLQALDFWRDCRDASFELGFLSIYGSPFMHWLGTAHAQGPEGTARPAGRAGHAAGYRRRRLRGRGDPHADAAGRFARVGAA